jgi:hypothetical protein
MPGIHPGFQPGYSTATTIASLGSKRDLVHSTGQLLRNMSIRSQKRPANQETCIYPGSLTSFKEAHEYGMDSSNPVVHGYDDTPYTRLESPSPPSSLEEKPRPEYTTRINRPAATSSMSPPNYLVPQPVPSTTITIRHPPSVATTDVATAAPLRAVHCARPQPFHRTRSRDQIPPPGVFFLDEDDE